jgi:hypothetical protein
MLLAMTAMRILIVWVYVNTESLFLAQLMHASSTGFLSILVPASVSPAQESFWYAVYGVFPWVGAIGIIILYGKHLARQQRVRATPLSSPIENSIKADTLENSALKEEL